MTRRSVALCVALSVVFAAIYVVAVGTTLPDVAGLATQSPAQTSFMRARARELGLPSDYFRVAWVPLDSISPLLACGVVKAEDRGFFRHRGVEWAAVRRIPGRVGRGIPLTGHSTITQQLARNLFLSSERSLHRKVQEIFIARRLEAALPKRRILELYLNTVEWGEGVWGARDAGARYFGRPADSLGAFESAALASLLAAPRRHLVGPNRRRALYVQRRVLIQLYGSGIIDARDFRAAAIRSETFGRALRDGAAEVSALRGASDGALVATGSARTVDAVLASECGLARELHAEQVGRIQMQRDARKLSDVGE